MTKNVPCVSAFLSSYLHIFEIKKSISFKKEIGNEGGRLTVMLSSLQHAEREVKGS